MSYSFLFILLLRSLSKYFHIKFYSRQVTIGDGRSPTYQARNYYIIWRDLDLRRYLEKPMHEVVISYSIIFRNRNSFAWFIFVSSYECLSGYEFISKMHLEPIFICYWFKYFKTNMDLNFFKYLIFLLNCSVKQMKNF